MSFSNSAVARVIVCAQVYFAVRLVWDIQIQSYIGVNMDQLDAAAKNETYTAPTFTSAIDQSQQAV